MDTLIQSERSECGLVALAALLQVYGLRYDLATLRSRYPASIKGYTLKNIITLADSLGLQTRALRCEVGYLPQLRLPAILHWRMDHFVVLLKCRRDRFVIHDPAIGRVTVTRAEIDECFTGVALEAWPKPTFEKIDARNRLSLNTLIPINRVVIKALISSFVLALGIETTVLLIPILQQFIIDDVFVTSDGDLLKVLTIAITIFLVGQASTTAVRGLIQRNITSYLSLSVSSYIFAHLLSLSPSWFEARSSADILNRFESGNAIHKTVTTSVVSSGIDGLVVLVALGAMAIYSLQLTGIAVLAFLLYTAVRILYYRTNRQQIAALIVQDTKVQGLLLETMRGIATIKSVNGELWRHQKYILELSQLVQKQQEITTINTAFKFIHDIAFTMERVIVVYLGARAVMFGSLSSGMLIAFFSFRENFVGKSTSLIDTFVEFRMLSIHLDRLSDIILTHGEPITSLPFLGSVTTHGRIDVRNISYRYGDFDPDILKNCSITIESGEIVAIVGPSGIGKSTLFNILSGQIEPRSGEVLFDGLPLKLVGLRRLRDLIAIVRQGDMLFSGSITENIAFLDNAPDHDRVRDAAAKAGIHQEVQSMPMGYNSLIGQMGTGLSGGQAQRIMIARALYKKPKILMLDEATSHLDIENERHIWLTLRELGITQVIIAHRPETIANADRVVDIREISH